jgi:polyisoprenoid-binding protein YceI
MNKIIAAIAFTTLANISFAQVQFTKNGTIQFKSTTTNTVDKVEATNKSAVCKLNTATGEVEFGILIKSFVFTNDLMQQHFNENYMESDKFPKSTFKGKIETLSAVNFKADGVYKVLVQGAMTIHGVTKNVKVPGTVTIKGGKIAISSAFGIALADYGISLPGAVKDKISKEISTVVNCSLQSL